MGIRNQPINCKRFREGLLLRNYLGQNRKEVKGGMFE